MSTTLPTDEQRQRAEWDRLLLEIEQRTAQLRSLNGVETDLKTTDRDLKLEQLRQIKTYEPVKLVLTTATTLVVVIGGLGAGVIWLWHVLH
jgi:hypothetical protein